MGDGMDYLTPEKVELNRVAKLLIDEWERVENEKVNCSRIATFVDMARVVVADTERQVEDSYEAGYDDGYQDGYRSGYVSREDGF